MLALTAGAACREIEDVTGIDTSAHALRFLNRGYSQFLSGVDPRDEMEHSARHNWSFLKPLAELTLTYQTTGTATGVYDSSAYTVVTATADKFAVSNIGDDIVVADTGTYTIVKWVSATVVWISGDNAFADKGFTLPHAGIYDLPAGFGGLISRPVFPYSTSEPRRPLAEVDSETILEHWAQTNVPSYPSMFAVVPLTFTAATGQRWQMMFAPRVDADRFVRYQYIVIPSALTDSPAVYMLGGAPHCYTILMAALAAFETMRTQPGFYAREYVRHFIGSIDHDKGVMQTRGPQQMGHDGPESAG